jgi:exonuclease SbcD
MRILHTSDWHLGKTLENFPRFEEQEKFLDDFVKMAEEYEVDMVVIAGDIYDSSNPPAKAEMLFYDTLKRLANGKRVVLAIAGNHDNPDRLSAASPLAYEQGVILLGSIKTVVPTGDFGSFKVLNSGEGFFEIEIKGERAVVIALPYPSEKRLNEIFSESMEEEERQRSYSERVGRLFEELSKNYREDTVNIAVSHLYVAGGEEAGSERPIQLGGSFTVELRHLPEKAQYIALGHLHKPQRISDILPVYYSGSPLQYSKSEINQSKCAYLVELKAGEKPRVREIYFKNYKPIEVIKCNGVEEALKICEEYKNKNIWAYFEIKTESPLPSSVIREMKRLIPDIVEIRPILPEEEGVFEEIEVEDKDIRELFQEFYQKEKKVPPSEELVELFMSIIGEEDEGV